MLFKKLALTAALICGLAAPAFAEPIVGKPAPTFIATDVAGKSVDLTALKGKTVVLEWTNYGCPFVRKHYDSGNMQKLQKDAVAKDVVWVSIMSSAEGKEGFYATDKLAELGVVPKEAAATIWAKAKDATFDVARVDEIEAVTKHDVIAFLTHLGEIVGEESRFTHQGMTSSDVLDTCLNVQLTRASDILLADLDKLLAALKRRAFEHKVGPRGLDHGHRRRGWGGGRRRRGDAGAQQHSHHQSDRTHHPEAQAGSPCSLRHFTSAVVEASASI